MGGTRGSSRRRRTIQTKIEAIVTKHVDHRWEGKSSKKALNMVLAI